MFHGALLIVSLIEILLREDGFGKIILTSRPATTLLETSRPTSPSTLISGLSLIGVSFQQQTVSITQSPDLPIPQSPHPHLLYATSPKLTTPSLSCFVIQKLLKLGRWSVVRGHLSVAGRRCFPQTQ